MLLNVFLTNLQVFFSNPFFAMDPLESYRRLMTNHCLRYSTCLRLKETETRKKYEQKCEKNRENARRRYSSQIETQRSDTIASNRMPSQANACISNNNNNEKSNSKNNDDIANAININMESNQSIVQSNGNNSSPRIDKQ